MRIFLKLLLAFMVYFSMSDSLPAQNPAYLHVFNKNYLITMYTDSTELWVGHQSGMTKYDINTGQKQEFTIENCGLPYRFVRAITKDLNGDIWCSGDYSFAHWSGGQFIKYDASNSPFNGYFFEHMAFDAANNLWIGYYNGTDGGIAKFDGANWTLYNSGNSPFPGSQVSQMQFDKNGLLWLSVRNSATLDGGLMSFDGTNWIQYDSLLTSTQSFGNFGVAVDTSGNVYASTLARLYKYNGSVWQEIYNIVPGGFGPFNILGVDKTQNLWFWYVTSNMTYCLVKYDGTNFTNYPSGGGNSLANYWQYCFAVDQNNKIWLGFQGGLQSFDGTLWKTYYNGIGPSSFVTDVVPLYNGKMLVSTGYSSGDFGGIGLYDGNDWEVYTNRNSGLLFDDVECMAADQNNNVYIGVSTGSSAKPIYKLTGNTITPVNSFPGTATYQSISQIEFDSNNKLWAASYGTLYSMTGTVWETFDISNIPNFPSGSSIVNIAIDSQDNLWMLCLASGPLARLFKYDGTNWTYTDCPWPSSQIRSLAVDSNDKLWMATFTIGAITYDGTVWQNYNSGNSGILTDTINVIGSDNFGIIYAETYWGRIMRYDGISWNYININNEPIVYAGTRIRTDAYNNMYFCNGTFLTIFNLETSGINATWLKPKVKGNVFYDANQNGINDINDPGFPNQPVTLFNDGSVNFSDQNGDYSIPVEIGWNFFGASPVPLFQITNGSGSYAGNIQSDSCCYDFGLAPQVATDSLAVTLSTGIYRCGFDVQFYMTVMNKGTTYADATLVLNHPSSVTYVSADTLPATITTDSVTWNLFQMYPGEIRNIMAFMNIPNTPGVNICINSSVGVAGAGVYMNSDTTCSEILCSADPNDKSTEPVGVGPNNFILNGSPIEYMIRFQNLGTDTAFTVIVVDTLSSYLDWQSFQLIGFSAPVQTQLTANGILKFSFYNIRIPPSSVNEPASHGFVKFRINQTSGIPDSTVIDNIAQIYFDFNQPIFTNNAFVTVVPTLPNSIHEISSQQLNTQVIPNPFNEVTTLRMLPPLNEEFEIVIADLTGKVVYSDKKRGLEFRLETSGWKAGMYFYSIINREQGILKTGKLVKL